MFPKTIVTWLRPQVSPTECSEGLIGTGIAWGGGGGLLPRDGIHKLPSLWNAGWWGRGPRGDDVCVTASPKECTCPYLREKVSCFWQIVRAPPKCKNYWSKPVCSAVWINMAEKKASVEFFYFYLFQISHGKMKRVFGRNVPSSSLRSWAGFKLIISLFLLVPWLKNRGYCLCWECIEIYGLFLWPTLAITASGLGAGMPGWRNCISKCSLFLQVWKNIKA